MKIMKTENLNKEIFFINEKKITRGMAEMSSYRDSANKILKILETHELEITTAEIALQALSAPVEKLAGMIAAKQKQSLINIPESSRGQLLTTPDLSQIQIIRNVMSNTAAYNAGFVPNDHLKYDNGKFEVDEPGLREHFTNYRNKQIDKVEFLVADLLKSWENLQAYSKTMKISNLIGFQGILNFDRFTETFSFDRTSPDIKEFLKTTEKKQENHEI